MQKILKWWVTELKKQLPYQTYQNFKMIPATRHFRLVPHYWALIPNNQLIGVDCRENKTWSDGPRLTMKLISID